MRHIKAHNLGLSMIELLVALAISSFLILGITQVYINNKSNYDFQQSQASNMDAGRFLQIVLNEQIAKAGYRRAPDQEFESAFKARAATGECAAFAKEAVVTSLKDNATGFCIRYQPAVSGEQACDGVDLKLSNPSAFISASDGEMAYVAIKHEWNNDLHQGKITCNGQDLIEGVADFNVEFLLGQTPERRFQSNPYKKASDYNATDIVRGIKYSALLASRPNQRSGMDSNVFNQWKNNADADTKAKLDSNDNNRIYQVVSSTQVLRNLVP